MFCICCLDTSGPLVTITRSVHGDFMDVFPISDVDPPLVPVVCYACHTMLKKIHQFKLQVEKSFSLLINKAHNIEKKEFMMSNMSKDVHSNKPEIPETLADQTKKDTKMNTIKAALDIINSNCTSLQSLAVCNFKTITETLLEVTCDNLNLELRGFKASTENNEQPQKKAVNSTCTTPMLPVEIADKLEKEVTHFIELSPVIDNASGMDVLPTLESVNDDDNMTQLSDEAVEIKEELKIEVVDEDICTKVLLPDNTGSVLPDEIENSPIEEKSEDDSKVDVFIHNVYGTAVLPAELKNEPDEVSSDSVAINNLESNEAMNDSAIKNLEPNNISSDDSTHNNGVIKKSNKRPSPPLIPVRLNKGQLRAERRKKKESKEYRRWSHRCHSCVIGFQYKENLDDHNRRKHEMKHGCITCNICRQVVSQKESKDHQSRHYYRIECGKCKQRFVLFDEAYEHYKNDHSSRKKRSTMRNDLRTYWRQKRESRTKVPEYTSTVETITSGISSPGSSLDFAETLTRDVMTKINELHYCDFYFYSSV